MKLGEGASGQAEVGEWEGVECAVKKVDETTSIDAEIRALRRLVGNKYVVQLLGVRNFSNGDTHLYMEKMSTTLEAHCGDKRLTMYLSRSLICAVASIHAAGITHGDIKPANVMVDAQGGLRLIDFGLCSFAPSSNNPDMYTPQYRAPEIFLGAEYTCAIDVWAVGCTVYELAATERLFEYDDDDVLEAIFEKLGTPDALYGSEALTMPGWKGDTDYRRSDYFEKVENAVLRKVVSACISYREYRPTARRLCAALCP